MPTVVEAPTTREHLSFSQLKLAANCGEAYRRRYVEGEQVGALTVPAMVGSAFHESIAAFESALRLARPEDPEAIAAGHWVPEVDNQINLLCSLVRHTIDGELRSKGVNSESLFHYGKQDLGFYYREKLPKMAERYVNHRIMEETSRQFAWGIDDDPTKSIEVESLIEVGGHPFLSFIDQVFCDSAGRIVIRDLKTGNPSSGDAMQIEQYRLSLWRSHGIQADYGQVLYLGKGSQAKPETVKFTLSDHDLDRMTGRVLRNIGEGTLLINGPFTGACHNCEFRLDCDWGSVTTHGSS